MFPGNKWPLRWSLENQNDILTKRETEDSGNDTTTPSKPHSFLKLTIGIFSLTVKLSLSAGELTFHDKTLIEATDFVPIRINYPVC